MTPKRTFLLLVLGLDMLAWFFPVKYAAAIFGFVTIWAVLGFRWGVAVSIFAVAPDMIQGAYIGLIAFYPILHQLMNVSHACQAYVSNQTLTNECFKQNLNITLSSRVLPSGMPRPSALPKPPAFLTYLANLPIAIKMGVLIPVWLGCVYWLLRQIIKIRDRIRNSIGHVYGFRPHKKTRPK